MKLHLKIATVLLGALAMLGTAGVARADCYHSILHRERDLDHAIARHGFRSPQAEHARWELDRARAVCGAYR
jgi:hypothetical protein